MKRLTVIGIITCVLCGCSTRPDAAEQGVLSNGNWIDLSHAFSADTGYWATAETCKRSTGAAGETPDGSYNSAYQFCASQHGGTHIDAPVHFAEARSSVDQ